MSNASVALPLSCSVDLSILRAAGQVVAGAVQIVGFALVVWLMLAGPGFLAEDAASAQGPHTIHR